MKPRPNEALPAGPPYRDGEQIPDTQIRRIFRQPPDLPRTFNRSALLVGPLGAGKTVLFRYHKVTHDEAGGTALHINLIQDLASISQRDTIGPWASDIPGEVQQQVAGKASSLLALSIATRLVRKRALSPSPTWLTSCLPDSFSSNALTTDLPGLNTILRKVAHAPLRDFSGVFDTRPLGMFLARIAGELQNSGSPLLLLFDRADLVSAPALFPVLDLLNQTFQYRALLATRPGHPAGAFFQACYGGVPGDHYDVWQLASRPHVGNWLVFLRDALAAQFANQLDRLKTEHLDAILAFSEGSCRIGVELLADMLDLPHPDDAHLLGALDVRHINATTRVRNVLRQHGLDYSDALSAIRRRLRELNAPCGARPLLRIERSLPTTLWMSHTRGDAFFDDALRVGALSIGGEEQWVPGARPATFEVPQALFWTKKDGIDALLKHKHFPIDVSEKDILAASRGPTAPPKLFVAFRMNVPESKAFRGEFERAIRGHPELHTVGILDGTRVPEGAEWAGVIRKRIRSATVVVADVTGLRSDVIFEVGFAFGLRKIVIPMVVGVEQLRDLPTWLRIRQLGRYNSSQDIDGLVGTVHSYLLNRALTPMLKPSRPSPSLAVWYPANDWSHDAEEQFRYAGHQEAMSVEIIGHDTPDSIVIKQATSASLLGIGLDGTEADSLAHFLCGALVGSPRAGQGGTLLRRIIIVIRPGLESSGVVAASLANCVESAHVARMADVRQQAQAYGSEYRKWRNRIAGNRSN